jgi:hypothetical protein
MPKAFKQGGVLVFFVLMLGNASHVTAGGTGNQAQAAQARDPFTTSGPMYQEMGRQSLSGPGRGFIPSLGMDNVPKMKLRGYINDNPKRGATALLEVEGAGIFLVKAGDEIGLQAIGRNQVLKVVKVDAQRVEVQAGQINQVIIVR